MKTSLLAIALTLTLLSPLTLADPATPLTALAKLPVKEVTVFKDGHAFVLHSGRMPVDASGNVVLDALPSPVLGTFWPYSADKNARLVSVTASAHKVKLERTALSVRELIEANVGSAVTITETPINPGRDAQPVIYSAVIDSIPTQSGEELEATTPPGTGEKLPVKGGIVMLKTATGVKAVPFERILDVTFSNDVKTKLANEEFRNLLTLGLDWANQQRQNEADVGMVYLQRGLRWIPNYKIAIDGKGQAVVRLQATLINELTDLQEVTAHLVIGVPSFAFAATQDPIALQQQAAQLSQYFANPGNIGNNIDTNYALSNAMMTQQARMGEVRYGAARPQAGAPAADLGPDVASQGKAEDLFLFTVRKLSLKKGQRTVLTVAEYKVAYKDVYALDIPVAPPAEVFRQFDDARKAELARLFNSPKVMHRIRVSNTTAAPFTTAPAILVQNDRLIAQGMMTYTAPGNSVDIDMTNTVDVVVKKTDTETARVPNAQILDGTNYMRVDLSGKIALTSFAKQNIEVEVTRHIMGNLDTVDKDGKKQSLNLLEDATYAPTGGRGSASYGYASPYWYHWYNWPWWWSRFNGVSRVTWTATLEPQKTTELNYTWHYYWR
jgi:hypothetical protein